MASNAYLKRHGFTLAEVLITLGIIGIVAALTLPQLTQKYKKQEVETKLAKFYTNIQQAVILAEAEHGDKLYWDEIGNSCTFISENEENPECEKGSETALQWYNKYLAKYLISTSVEAYLGTNKHAYIIVKFTDGSAMALCSDGTNFYINAKYIGKDITPEFGTVAFPFIFDSKKGFVPNSWNIDYKDLCKQGTRGVGCTQVIAENGWKIPDDYPWKF